MTTVCVYVYAYVYPPITSGLGADNTILECRGFLHDPRCQFFQAYGFINAHVEGAKRIRLLGSTASAPIHTLSANPILLCVVRVQCKQSTQVLRATMLSNTHVNYMDCSNMCINPQPKKRFFVIVADETDDYPIIVLEIPG